MSQPLNIARKYPHIICEGELGYQRCTRCIMDTTDPTISFDANGVCNHCLQVDRWKLKWNPEGDSVALEQLMETIKKDGSGKEYDMIMGLSGGVDSSYVAKLAKDFGLRTLVVHCDTGWNSELAVKNIENIVSKCGFDLVTHVVDWETMRNLQYAFFKSGVPNQDIPQDHAIAAVFYGYADKHKVKWSLSGSNFATESILPTAWGYNNLDLKHIQAIHREFGSGKLSKFPTMSYLKYGFYYQMVKGMQIAKPLNLINYKKGEAMKVLQESFEWKYYGGKHYESRFTKFFQGWYLPTKWGYDKRLAHLSSLVAGNEITRDQALNEFSIGTLPIIDIESDKDYMARKLGISDDEFRLLMSVPNQDHLTYDHTSERIKMLMAKFAAVPGAVKKIIEGRK
jgi:N-acetyl sugar amidotransferase